MTIMTTRKSIMLWLKAIEAAMPPPENCHHAITYAQYGSDAQGYEDKLALQLNVGGTFHCFFLDDSDFGIPMNEFICCVRRILDSASDFQRGVGLGQYTA